MPSSADQYEQRALGKALTLQLEKFIITIVTGALESCCLFLREVMQTIHFFGSYGFLFQINAREI